MYIYVKTYAYIFNQIQITLLLELGKVDSYLKELSKFSLKKKKSCPNLLLELGRRRLLSKKISIIGLL